MELKDRVFIYDTTLRDGSQKKGISYSLENKISILKELDAFGVDYVEGGWPGSNPKDKEFFERARLIDIKTKLVAFGSTRRKLSLASEDANLLDLLQTKTSAVALVGKSSVLHVKEVLRTSLKENLLMIEDSISFLKEKDREVIYDAEHFFDGYKLDPEYAIKSLERAVSGGASWLVLCDTNGGTMTDDIQRIVTLVCDKFSVPVGIHAHNDCELAVANSISAVISGARQVQGTVNGFGERCGNANLISVIPNLQIKLGYNCVSDSKLNKLVHLSRFISEKANLASDPYQPYVGSAAFAHKGGLHVAAVERCAESYEHIDPSLVGNKREIVISELSGKGNIRMLASEWGVGGVGGAGGVASAASALDSRAVKLIKQNEQLGYQYEGAEGSVELIMHQVKDDYISPFTVTDYVVVSEKRAIPVRMQSNLNTEETILEGVRAIVKLNCQGQNVHTAAEGDGPVHALDLAMRKALVRFFPVLDRMKLLDYKVRIVDPETATSAITRVTIEAGVGDKTWTTVGCGRNIISASFKALIDSFELLVVKEEQGQLTKGRSLVLLK